MTIQFIMKLANTTLEKMGLSEIESKIFIAMLEGYLRVKDIQNITSVKRPSVYYAISNLEKRGLVGRIQVGEYNQWKVSPLSKLYHILDERKQSLEALTHDVDDFVASVPILKNTSETKVTYYEGTSGIESIVFNSLYCKDKEIWSIAPDKNFFFERGAKFATKYVSERRKRGIKTRNLWENIFDREVVKVLYEDVSEIRIMPKSMHGKFQTTVFIYDDKVMYIAPQKSNYAVIFQSKDHSSFMRAVYEAVWNVSKKRGSC